VLGGALATLLLASVGPALAAPEGSPDRAEVKIKGKKFVREGGQWYRQDSEHKRFKVDSEVVTVKFKPGLAESEKGSFLKRRNAKKLRANAVGAVDITVPKGMSAVEFVQKLQDEGALVYAEVNTVGEYLQLIPNDTDFDELWGLDNTGQTGGTADADVDAPEAWEITTGSPSVVVAVLDSGTEYDHEDLECNIWVNPGEDLDNDGVVWDTDDLNGIDDDGNGFVDDLVGWDFDDADNDPRGSYFHGTHVAGVVGACGNNATGVIGVGGGVGPGTGIRMMIANVGDSAPNSAVLDDAIIYAADNGARVITMSLSVGDSTAISDALEYAYDTMGAFINNASGNWDPTVQFPATDVHVMAVGATDHDDVRAVFSNPGPELEVAAPGVQILSTQPGDTYDWSDGTSFASPHVAGTAGLMFSLNPSATNQEVRDCITSTAEDKGDPGRDDLYGFGRLNTADALACIAANLPPVCDADGPYTAECGLPAALDGTGSYDPDGDPLTFVWSGPFDPSPSLEPAPTVVFLSPTGEKTVSLVVTDSDGESDSCESTVTVQDTLAPYLEAPEDVLTECTSADGTPVDLGSPIADDECDDSLTIGNDAPPLFPLGTTTVTWSATDDDSNSSLDTQVVVVEDTTPPQAYCNAPATITPPDAPIAFTATADDGCGLATVTVTDYDCFKYNKAGKRVNKKYSCQVALSGDTITVLDSGGVADNIAWTIVATDESGNSTTVDCGLTVVNPAK